VLVGDLPPPWGPRVGRELHLPFKAVDGAPGVELEPECEVLLPDLSPIPSRERGRERESQDEVGRRERT
jgi:hypothetical protein